MLCGFSLPGMRRAIAVAAGTNHALAILGMALAPKVLGAAGKARKAGGQGVPSLRSLCEVAAQDMVDIANVASCCTFTEVSLLRISCHWWALDWRAAENFSAALRIPSPPFEFLHRPAK